MSKIWKPQDISVYRSWAETVETELSDTLNDWELSFMSSIIDQLGRDRNLTEAQAEKLESIYCRTS